MQLLWDAVRIVTAAHRGELHPANSWAVPYVWILAILGKANLRPTASHHPASAPDLLPLSFSLPSPPPLHHTQAQHDNYYDLTLR